MFFILISLKYRNLLMKIISSKKAMNIFIKILLFNLIFHFFEIYLNFIKIKHLH
jgi:hypothetical protein